MKGAMDKISSRTLVLIAIRNHELSEGRGIGINELVEKMSGMERATVSKSLDSLDDMGLIHQMDAEMVLHGDGWTKLMTTTKDSQPFIDGAIKDLVEKGLLPDENMVVETD